MARTPKFNTPRTSPPASGWTPGHRAPALGYGNLDGVSCDFDDYDADARKEYAKENDDKC